MSGAFGNVIIKKHMAHPFRFGTKLVDTPLVKVENYMTHPKKHEIYGCRFNETTFVYELVGFTFSFFS